MKQRRPKGLGTVEKTSTGFRARRTINGQRVCGTTRKTRLEAERDLRNLTAQTRRPDEVPTFSEYAESLLNGRFMKRHKRSSWETNEISWRLYISPSKLGRMKLDTIKRRDVQAFVDGISKSARYVRRIGAFLSVCLSEAVHDEFISVNPSSGVRYPEVEERENRTLAPEEAILLLNPTDRLSTMVLVAAHTGLRRGELCGLRWEDVKDGFLRIRRAISPVRGGDVETTTKTRKSMSDIPLTQEAENAIRSQPNRGKYVFSTSDGGPISPSNLSRDWRKWAKDHELTGMRLHDLRGSFVSLLIESGADIRTVQELARHADPRTTMTAYARSRKPVKDEAVKRFRLTIVPTIGHMPADTSQNRAFAV
jgi:integrase